MFNNFIGGGQVFLHKVRMLRQVLGSTILVSLIAGVCLTWNLSVKERKKIDIDAAVTFIKANIALTLHPAISAISIKNAPAMVDAYSNGRIWQKSMRATNVISSHKFKLAWHSLLMTGKTILLQSVAFGVACGFIVFLFWSILGKKLKSDKAKEGSSVILTPNQVKQRLRSLKKASWLKIDKMPLVKDMETRHFLISGQTGCGKTHMMHHMLVQIEQKEQPCIVVDQTGEMIARYYNPDRGDIIFNPFDARSHDWDFWYDLDNKEEIENFSKILFSFNRKRSRSSSDSFWEQSAETVFNGCVEYLIKENQLSIETLADMAINANIQTLSDKLKNTAAERFLVEDSKGMAHSVLGVLSASSRPISYLTDQSKNGMFSLKRHFQNIQDGSKAWLFLATKPSARELTLPLISCLVELAMSRLIDIGEDPERRIWCIFDELAALGNLPTLPTLMSEGRKYGACIVTAMQSLNQLYDIYGRFKASSIFGQFGTSFFFRNTEPDIAKMLSDMCGSRTLTKQQKNISFGANEFRDGISYSDHEKTEPILRFNDLANLDIGSSYALLPEPTVRLSKIQVPSLQRQNKNQPFINNMEN